MATVKPTEFVKEHAPWSVSKADTAKQCPHKFYLQYIVKKRVDLGLNTAALIGQAVHSAVEYILTGRPVNKCFMLAAEEHNLTSEEIELALDFVPAARNFLKKYESYSQRHALKSPVVESKLAIDIDGNPVRFFDNDRGFLRGVIDLYAPYKRVPYMLILDHKTGKEHDISHFMNQFRTYLLLLKAKEPGMEKAQVGINYLKTDRVEMHKGLLDTRDIQPIFEEVVKYLNVSTENAHNSSTVRPGPLCNWCDYKRSGDCPAFSDGVNGKSKR